MKADAIRKRSILEHLEKIGLRDLSSNRRVRSVNMMIVQAEYDLRANAPGCFQSWWFPLSTVPTLSISWMSSPASVQGASSKDSCTSKMTMLRQTRTVRPESKVTYAVKGPRG